MARTPGGKGRTGEDSVLFCKAPRWRGPAKILDIDDAGVRAKFRSQTLKVARCCVRKKMDVQGAGEVEPCVWGVGYLGPLAFGGVKGELRKMTGCFCGRMEILRCPARTVFGSGRMHVRLMDSPLFFQRNLRRGRSALTRIAPLPTSQRSFMGTTIIRVVIAVGTAGKIQRRL